MEKFKTESIKKFKYGAYQVYVSLDFIEESIERYSEKYNLDMCPDFQRGHVWNEDQQIAYLEFLLRGGKSGNVIYFNCPGFMGDYKEEMVVVDGLQRLTAILKFLRNEIKVFGYYCKDYDEIPKDVGVYFNVNNIESRSDVLKWYIDFNSGGTVHSNSEIDRVRALLREENKKQEEQQI